ncbi:myosin-3-like [Engraulis encrasicolus]|uniref:myosin-3-like n=1 Tax=Engraulis encrasicolus TaxID=184585 RepID=UPI002FD4349C
MECEIKAIFHHVDGNHKQTCSNLERASQLITEALQYEFRQNTTLHMLIHRLEERAAENGRSLSEQVESNRQLKLQVDELQKQLEDKDNSLTQAKQSITMLKNELRDIRQQLHSQENSQRTIQEVTEWLQDGESQPNAVKEEGSVLPNTIVGIKEEVADDGYPCNQSDDTDDSTEHTDLSSADIKAEIVKN